MSRELRRKLPGQVPSFGSCTHAPSTWRDRPSPSERWLPRAYALPAWPSCIWLAIVRRLVDERWNALLNTSCDRKNRWIFLGARTHKASSSCRRVVAYWIESPSRTSCARGQCGHMSYLPLLRRWFMDVRSHRSIGYRLCTRPRILDSKRRDIDRRRTRVLGACRNGVPAVHRAGSMRAILRSRLYNRCPVGLSGARHITLAAGSGRSSSRLASRSGSL